MRKISGMLVTGVFTVLGYHIGHGVIGAAVGGAIGGLATSSFVW